MLAPQTEETSSNALSVGELTTCNATRKSLAIARRNRDAVVLGADTLVALEGEVIGKPANRAEARAIIGRLNGRVHEVCTGVFICSAGGRRSSSFQVFSQVQFRRLTGAEIDKYLAKIDPLDKAGAYAAQGHGTEIIEEIRGSYTNVVGLPVDETLRELHAFGIAM